MSQIRLGDLLIRAGVVNDGQLNAALAEQKQWGGRLGTILVRMGALSEDLLGQHLGSLVGSTQRVLVEGLDKERGELWSGRTDRHEIVHIGGAAGLDLAGDVVLTNIVRSNKHSLQGELSATSRAAARPRVAPAAPARRSLPLVASAEGV